MVQNINSGITITSAKYLTGYKIKINFSDGHTNVFDYKNIVILDYEETKHYRSIKRFKKFKICEYKLSIVWGDNYDMAMHPEILYSWRRVPKHWYKTKLDLIFEVIDRVKNERGIEI